MVVSETLHLVYVRGVFGLPLRFNLYELKKKLLTLPAHRFVDNYLCFRFGGDNFYSTWKWTSPRKSWVQDSQILLRDLRVVAVILDDIEHYDY